MVGLPELFWEKNLMSRLCFFISASEKFTLVEYITSEIVDGKPVC